MIQKDKKRSHFSHTAKIFPVLSQVFNLVIFLHLEYTLNTYYFLFCMGIAPLGNTLKY